MTLPKRKRMPATVRRSVALPGELVAAVRAAVGPELGSNLNRVVRMALEEFVARRRQMDFERQLEAMAADPDIRRENARVSLEFRRADGDGLRR